LLTTGLETPDDLQLQSDQQIFGIVGCKPYIGRCKRWPSSLCEISWIFLFLNGASLYTHATPWPRWRQRWQMGFSCPQATFEIRQGLHAAFLCWNPEALAPAVSIPYRYSSNEGCMAKCSTRVRSSRREPARNYGVSVRRPGTNFDNAAPCLTEVGLLLARSQNRYSGISCQ
jgi:hypothetical protein